MKNSYILLSLLILLLVGCVSQRHIPKGSEAFESVIVTPDTSVIPLFDASVLYVLAREYENSNDTLISMGEYVEERLIEIYPERAYKGMMSKVAEQTMSRLQNIRKSPQFRANVIDGLTLSSLNESYFNAVSDSAEVEFMDMTEAEASVYWELNSLADSKGNFQLVQIDSIRAFDSEWGLNAVLMGNEIPYIAKEEWVMSFVSMGVASSIIYRILQSKARAEYVARHFFHSNTSFGKRGDAYKHIFVNLLLRKYTTSQIAWLVMDVYWEWASVNSPCDNVMDYHNNLVGREYQYENFLKDSEDWRRWAYIVRDFVNDTTHNAEFMNWRLNTPTLIVNEEEKKVDPRKYIYWSKDSEPLSEAKKMSE
jgi:hypothetical protein